MIGTIAGGYHSDGRLRLSKIRSSRVIGGTGWCRKWWLAANPTSKALPSVPFFFKISIYKNCIQTVYNLTTHIDISKGFSWRHGSMSWNSPDSSSSRFVDLQNGFSTSAKKWCRQKIDHDKTENITKNTPELHTNLYRIKHLTSWH